MIVAVDAARWGYGLGVVYRLTAGNLLASAIWAPVAFVGAFVITHLKTRALHQRLDRQDVQLAAQDVELARLHDKQDQVHAHLGISQR